MFQTPSTSILQLDPDLMMNILVVTMVLGKQQLRIPHLQKVGLQINGKNMTIVMRLSRKE
jgi:hypothetical protein